MISPRRLAWGIATCVALATALPAVAAQRSDDNEKAKEAARPKIKLTAQPLVSMAPARVVLTAELRGGANDFEEYYCPTVEWEWDDDTRSESTADCEPYEAGKSEIRRRFTVQHVYRVPGEYHIFFHLKRRDKSVATASVDIQVRPGLSVLDP
jgi:hypothetical protein